MGQTYVSSSNDRLAERTSQEVVILRLSDRDEGVLARLHTIRKSLYNRAYALT